MDGEAAWSTELGWMLSGRQKTAVDRAQATVAFIRSRVNSLPDIKEPRYYPPLHAVFRDGAQTTPRDVSSSNTGREAGVMEGVLH